MSAKCRSCGAEVRWVTTESGKHMPVDALPSAVGNIVLADDVAIVLRQGQPRLDGEPLYTSHFATCEHAEKWRRK